jgi:hypothetical protein
MILTDERGSARDKLRAAGANAPDLIPIFLAIRYNKPCYSLASGYPEDMNVSLTDELETLIEE